VSGFGVSKLPRIVRGRGSYVFDESGKRYLDGSGGPAVFSVGHGHPEVNAAICAQLEDFAHGYRYLFTTNSLEALSRAVLTSCGAGFQDVIFCGSGSEAVEGALKVALQHFAARGLGQKRRFISRRRSWHGNTLGALSVSDFSERRSAFEGSLLEVDFVSAANTYRPPDGVPPEALTAHLAAEFERALARIGPERVAAFIMEPIVGAAGGVVPAPPGYAQAIQQICHRHEILLIADEVMCGAGRSGTWRALEFDGVVSDILCIAKGLAGGYVPLGATVVGVRVAAPIHAAHGGYQTGHTFTGHTTACAAGLAVQNIIARDKLLERVRVTGAQLLSSLRDALAPFAEVGDIRGRGYFIGIELVRDRELKTPFPRARGLSLDISARCFENGLICYPCAGNVNGTDGDTIIVAPPYNALDTELEELVTKLTRGVAEALSVS
jgi:adenosylmethionine-8-amino-7-oxononanoate aminotransferase